MTVAEKALRVDQKLAVAAGSDDRLHGVGGFALQCAARSDDNDLHRQRLRGDAEGPQWVGKLTLGTLVETASA
jgi:hypothetical protein